MKRHTSVLKAIGKPSSLNSLIIISSLNPLSQKCLHWT